MKNRVIMIGSCLLMSLVLVGCGNTTNNKKVSSSSHSKVTKSMNRSSKTHKESSSSSISSISSSKETATDSNANTGKGVHLTGGQSTIDYINRVKGDHGWRIDAGTYGGAHGAPTSPDYVPYNRVVSADGNESYYVYANGAIVPASEVEQNGDQINAKVNSEHNVEIDNEGSDSDSE